MRALLQDADTTFVSHPEIFRHAENPNNPGGLDVKLAMLDRAVRACDPRHDVFLLGRSAGARVVTLLADRAEVSAVASLCYPFRPQGSLLEPERFSHLATLATPTLLLQGAQDPYGGIELTENYRLSEAIRLRIAPGNHEIRFAASENAYLLRKVRDFFDGGWRDDSENLDGFDEVFYQSAYPDIAGAIAEGHAASGRNHFERIGRREGRRFRMLVEGGD